MNQTHFRKSSHIFSGIFLFIVIVVLTSCASFTVRENIPSVEQNVWLVMQGKDFSSSSSPAIERSIIEQSLYYLFDFLEQRYGSERLAEWKRHYQSGIGFNESLLETYRKNLYILAYELNTELANGYRGGEILLLTNTAAVYDIIYLKDDLSGFNITNALYLVDSYYRSISNQLLNSAEKTALFYHKLGLLEEKKIPLYFLPERIIGTSGYFGDLYATFVVKEGATNRISLSVGNRMKYDSPFGFLVLGHEMTHLVSFLPLMPDMVFRFESDKLISVADTLMAILKTNGGIFQEGLAEYLSFSVSLYRKYSLLCDIDAELRILKKQGCRMMTLPELIAFNPEKRRLFETISERYLVYQLAHSLSRYLIENYGIERYLALLGAEKTQKNFKALYGIGIEEIDKAWKQKVFGE